MDKNYFQSLKASEALLDSEILSASFCEAISAKDNTPPESIQLFPPGTHTIRPFSPNGPVERTVTITQKTAQAIMESFNALSEVAARGEGPKPYIDFNHEDREASGWVSSVYWGGDDIKTGGVRAKIEWTKPGAEAVTGKAYRQFSPQFYAPENEIIGCPVNMGGLVNRPAFRKIAPIGAKQVSDNNPKPQNMNKLHAALVTAGLLSAIPTDEATAVIEFSERLNTLKAKQAKGDEAVLAVETQSGALKALESERDTLKKENETLKASVKQTAENGAKSIVAGWVKGIFAPKDTAAISAFEQKWVSNLIANPELAKDMEPIMKARASGRQNVLDPVIVAQGEPAPDLTGKTITEQIPLRAKELCSKDPKLGYNAAIALVNAQLSPDEAVQLLNERRQRPADLVK